MSLPGTLAMSIKLEMLSFGIVVAVVLSALVSGSVVAQASGVLSFDTGYIVSRIRTAHKNWISYILASSYEGIRLGRQRTWDPIEALRHE